MAQRKSSVDNKMPYYPRYSRRGLRPQLWITGPDPRRHDQYKAWLVHKAQARYRNEGYALTFEDWEHHWNQNNAWERRGRDVNDLCMVRIDSDQAWSKENVAVITRHEQLKTHNQKKIGTSYKKRSDTGKKRGPYDKKSY